MSEFQRDPNEIGALWAKTGSRGDYFTGTVNGSPIVVFRNDKKPGSKGPDWRILRPTPKPEKTETAW